MGRRYTDVLVTLHILNTIFINYLWNYAPSFTDIATTMPVLVINRSWNLFFLISTALLAWQYKSWVVGVSAFALIASDIVFLYVNLPWSLFSGIALGSIFDFIGLALMGNIICFLVARLKKRNSSLQSMNRKLVNHAATIEELAISWERNRLAQELHDTLAHSLSALTVQLEAVRSLWEIDTGKAFDLLGQADDTARNGLREARGALQALRAAPLQDLGLLLALETLAEESAGRINARLVKNLPHTPLTDLPMHLEQTVYRIAQESLENIVRHSGAKNITISLNHFLPSSGNEFLTIEIVDDGIGFDVNTIKEQHDDQRRWGLIGIQERAALIGGNLEITSEPGNGTSILLRVRIGKPEESHDQHSYM